MPEVRPPTIHHARIREVGYPHGEALVRIEAGPQGVSLSLAHPNGSPMTDPFFVVTAEGGLAVGRVHNPRGGDTFFSSAVGELMPEHTYVARLVEPIENLNQEED